MSGCIKVPNFGGAILLVGGPDRIITVEGKDYLFEDHHYCGPVPLNKRGAERTLRERHPFWIAVTRWYEEGKQIGQDGRCIWTPAPDPFANAVHIGGKDWFIPPLPPGIEACPGCKRCQKETP